VFVGLREGWFFVSGVVVVSCGCLFCFLWLFVLLVGGWLGRGWVWVVLVVVWWGCLVVCVGCGLVAGFCGGVVWGVLFGVCWCGVVACGRRLAGVWVR